MAISIDLTITQNYPDGFVLNWTTTGVANEDNNFKGDWPIRYRVYRSTSREEQGSIISVNYVRSEEVTRGAGDKDLLENLLLYRVQGIGDNPDEGTYEEDTDFGVEIVEGLSYIKWINGPSFGDTYYVSYYYEQNITIQSFTDPLAYTQLGLHYYYRIGLIYWAPDGPTETVSDPETLTLVANRSRQEYMVRERIRKNFQVLQLDGEPVRYFKKKRAGINCECVDLQSTGLPVDERCLECFGTRFIGGYTEILQYDPLAISMNMYPIPITPMIIFKQIPQSIYMNPDFLTQTASPPVWSTMVPEFERGDVLIRANNEHYRIVDPLVRHLAGMIYRLDASTAFIPRTDIIYFLGD